jgi:hypothetical protein
MSRTPSPTRTPGTPTTDLSGAKPKFNNGWTKEQEELMAGWADIAGCYRWMHDKCEKISARSNMWITVPVIILSTLTGSANFMLQSVIPPEDKDTQKYAQIAIGGVSIFTGILTTLGNFFRYAQNSEANRVASIAWGKFHRQVAVELRLHPKERIDSMDFLKICRAELDRLIEQSPPIPDIVIHEFEREFKDRQTLKKPDIAHGLDHTVVFVDKDTRLKQLTVEAAVMLKQKRKVWHQAMMPDVENHLEKRLAQVTSDLSGSLFQTLQDKVKELERQLEEQLEKNEDSKVRRNSTAHLRSFLRNTQSSRGRSQTRPIIRDPPPTPLTQKRVNHIVPGETKTTPGDLIQELTTPAFPESSFDMSFHSDEEQEKPAEERRESNEETT